MNENERLLSIGEISKLSFISVSALRYYDDKGVLKPKYIDPQSGYRYYSFSQIHELAFIKLATEIGISLLEISNFFRKDNETDFNELITLGETLALKKKKEIENTLSFIQQMKLELNEQENFKQAQHPFVSMKYTRYFFCAPIDKILSEIDFSKNLEELMKLAQKSNHYPYTEWGKLFIHQENEISKYLFIEVLPSNNKDDHIIEIPCGEYWNTYQETNQIDSAPNIYPEHFNSKKVIYVIETETFLTNNLDQKNRLLKLSISL